MAATVLVGHGNSASWHIDYSNTEGAGSNVGHAFNHIRVTTIETLDQTRASGIELGSHTLQASTLSNRYSDSLYFIIAIRNL
jgi:hypothetical protein